MRALIVDDERLARAELCRLLAEHPEVAMIGEASNGDEAFTLIHRLNPDLLFLDIQMPGGSGFDLLARLESVPHVIFTTAYDQFALRAFEVSALDYLLKPIEPDRLAAAIGKIKPPLGERSPYIAGRLSADDRVFVKDGDRCWFVRLGDISLFESEGNYTRIYFAGEKPMIGRTLAALEERLEPRFFFRVSRKHLVNLKHVVNVESGPHGGLLLTLNSGRAVEVSRRQAQKFRGMLSL